MLPAALPSLQGLTDLAAFSLRQMQALAGELGWEGAAFLTPDLAAALLGPHAAATLPRDLRRQGLALVCAVSGLGLEEPPAVGQGSGG